MERCQICKKVKVYICSDGVNAWCQNDCGNYAYFEGTLFFLGDNLGEYPVRPDGTIIRITRKEEGHKTFIEEERLIELEKKFREIINSKKQKNLDYDKMYDWWNNLSSEEKIEIWRQDRKN